MRIIPLKSIPNQSFSLTIGSNSYEITLKTVGDSTVADIARNGQKMVSSSRALPFSPLLPYPYQEDGNFVFVSSNSNLIHYENFNTTQALRFYSADELAVFREGAVMFDPTASVPLRYNPQGYA